MTQQGDCNPQGKQYGQEAPWPPPQSQLSAPQWQPQQYDQRAHQRRVARGLPPKDDYWQVGPYGPPQHPYQQQPAPVFPPANQGRPSAPGGYPPPAPQPTPPRARLRAPRRPPPRYPRFPSLVPRSRSRRSPSLFRVIYLGTHPLALTISLVISCLLIEVWAVIAMVVVFVWLLQCGVVAVWRAAAAMR